MKVGEQLQQARLGRGLSVSDVSGQTMMTRSVIEALESDDPSAFAGDVYRRAFLRQYCEFLGLDNLCLTTPPESKAQPAPPQKTLAAPKSYKDRYTPHPAFIRIVSLVGVLGVLILGFWVGMGTPKIAISIPGVPGAQQEAASSATTPLAEVVPEQPETLAVDSTNTLRIRLHIDKDCWVRVQSGGQQLFEGVLRSGSTREFRSLAGLNLRLGNAGGVRVQVNDEPEAVLGAPGEVVERSFPAPGETSSLY